jgi:hypothetical protein
MHWIDPDHLPEITGIVDQFLVNKHGEADGFLLTDGEEVHVPPHLSARLLRDVLPGSQVKVRGVRPRGVRIWSPPSQSIRQTAASSTMVQTRAKMTMRSRRPNTAR